MFSQVSFQGDSVLLQATCFALCFPKGRRGRSPQPPSEHLQLFKACGCNTTTGSHTHAKFLVLSSALHKLCQEMVYPTILLFLFDIMTRLADAHKRGLFHHYAAFLCGSKYRPSVLPGPGLNKNTQVFTFLSFTTGKKAHCNILPTSHARFNSNYYSDITIFIFL